MIPPEFEPHYIETQVEGDSVIVSFHAQQLTDDDNIEVFGRELFALIDQFGCNRIALDMSGGGRSSRARC